jgi:predicted kinase
MRRGALPGAAAARWVLCRLEREGVARLGAMLRPLILTGGPAVGKSTTAARLARDHHRAAFIDVDDVRHFVVAGHAAPWQGPEGVRQQRLGVENACALARRFAGEGFDVLIADVVTPHTITLYRDQLPGCLVIRLVVTPGEARRRAATREVHLTDAEFADLHARDRDAPPSADHHLDVTTMSVDQQAATISAVWRNRSVPGS